MERLFIGDIAKRFGLNPRTIRYYEGVGILPRARRTESGYRVYTAETIDRLTFILKAKALGLKLDEIKEIIRLYEKGEIPCDCTKSFIKNKIDEIDERIASLSELRARLVDLLKIGKLKGAAGAICPIITESKKST